MTNLIDLTSEITLAFGGIRFQQKDFLRSMNLKNTKRAKKLWAALRRAEVINKTPRKNFELTEKARFSAVA